jgi:hypothetical protein
VFPLDEVKRFGEGADDFRDEAEFKGTGYFSEQTKTAALVVHQKKPASAQVVFDISDFSRSHDVVNVRAVPLFQFEEISRVGPVYLNNWIFDSRLTNQHP